MRHRKTIFELSFILVLATAVACGGAPADPAEQVAEIRSGYTAELNSWVVDQRPAEQAPSTAAEDEAPAEGAPPEEETAGDGEAAAPEDEDAAEADPPVRQDVILDILVSHESRESLPGITVDVTQVDAEETPKNVWRVYLDTGDILPGPGTQLTHRLEDVDVESGDAFHVEVRHPVPAAERGEYREFQEYGAAEGQG
ncbi:MAG: hypothetical protein ACLF0P_14090 [Thermoanaerobaculia bacterium]